MDYYRQQFLSPSMKIVFMVILTLLFFFVSQVKAATYTSAGNGAWTLPTNWSPISGVGGPTATDIVIIKNSITLASGSSFNGTGSITIQSGGTLTVTGTYSIGTNGTRITIQGTGSLVVQSTFTIANQAFLALQNGSLSAATLVLSDYSSSGINYTSGTISITGGGSIYIGASETFSYPLVMNVPGGVTVKNGSTLSVTGVSNAIGLDNASIVILAPGTVTPTSFTFANSNDELRIAGATVNTSANINHTVGKINVNSGAFNTTGTLSVNGGAMTIASGATATSGNFSVTSSGSSAFSNAGTFTVTGTAQTDNNVTNSGTWRISSTYLNNNGTLTNSGTMSSGGDYTVRSTINNSGTVNVGTGASPKDLITTNSGANYNNTGFTNVYGNANFGGGVLLAPNTAVMPNTTSRMIVSGTLTVPSVGMTVGTGVAPPQYADLIVYGNIVLTGHNINVQCNGRVAAMSDLNISTGGGHAFNIQNCGTTPGGVPIGGQVYVDGDGPGISINSGSGGVNNNNPTFTYNGTPGTPYGLYVNGTVTGPVDADRGNVATLQATNPSFYTWVQSYTNNPLPVVLGYFKVSSNNDAGIALAWSTTLEKDFDRFELECAGEDLTFRLVTTVEGQGGINLDTKYQYLHKSPRPGKNYYRLKSIDIDGSYTYSDVVVGIYSGTDKGVSLYPNPIVNHSFTLELNDARTAPVSLSLIEARGYVVYSTQVDTSTSTITLPDDLKPGIYFAKIADGSGQQVIRVVIN